MAAASAGRSLGGRGARGTGPQRRPVRHRRIEPLHPADETSFGPEQNMRSGDQPRIETVLTRGDELRLQRLGAVMIAMIERDVLVLGRIIDVPMDE